LYAGDVIIFLEASKSNAAAVKFILDIFGGAFGLNCKMRKNYISPIYGCEDIF
jgi:hypothetical protein